MRLRITKLSAVLAAVVAFAAYASPPLRSTDPDSLRRDIVSTATDLLGTPYVLGASSDWGVDCSGLIYHTFASVLGYGIPRTVAQLVPYVEMIPRSNLEPGDLVFFDTVGPFSHVGIYVGDGKVIHAASDYNRNGVIISRFDREYYQERFNRAGRVAGETGIDKRDELWETAVSYLGTPYVSGGTSSTGADCSGFVYAVYRDVFDMELPRTVAAMAEATEPVDPAALIPGDLLFFDTAGPLTHVGIYLGNDKVIHAASEEIKNGVILSDLSAPYYQEHYAASGRLIPTEPVPWVVLRSLTSLRLSVGTPASLVSGLALYFNSLGTVDLGAEVRLDYTPVGPWLTVPLSVNLLLNDRGWFRVGYDAVASPNSQTENANVPAIVPDFLAVGMDLSPDAGRPSRVSLALELEYRLDIGYGTASSFAKILGPVVLSAGVSFSGEL